MRGNCIPNARAAQNFFRRFRRRLPYNGRISDAAPVIMRQMRRFETIKILTRAAVRWAAMCSLAASAPAAALDLRLTSGDWRPINIFVEKFSGEEDEGAERFSDIIRDDLVRSGYFRDRENRGDSGGEIYGDRYAEVRARGGEYLLAGAARGDSGGGRLFFELHDALTEKSLGEFSINFAPDSRRLAAHTVSNWVFETIAKLPGVFHTKVAYVVRQKDGMNLLRVADYDGHNAHTVLSSPEPLISPAWSPDGNELLYVSFEQRKPVVYRQNLLTGERRAAANFPGSNSAPAMSPDRQKIAVALTENRTLQQIFILSATGKRQMREEDAIDTEPAWSPDGRRIAFESDASGAPQIYEFDLDAGRARRVSFGVRYAVSPSYDGGGERILHIRRGDNGRNNVAVTDLASGETAVLTDVREADSPSFSPNDAMVLFKDENYENYLHIVAINGTIISQWKVRETGRVINPVWGPAKSDWF
ncbi:MAG: Tol-Pal system beta propeller repeat protein TolB [Gammaproteobacteria bacterium]